MAIPRWRPSKPEKLEAKVVAGPWEKYQTAPEAGGKPWEKYSAPRTPIEQVGGALGQLSQGIVKGGANMIDTLGALTATAADTAVGMSPDQSVMEKFQGYVQQRPLSNAIDTTLGTQERAPANDLERYTNMGGQALGSAPAVGLKAVSAFAGGFGAGVGSDVGKEVIGGKTGEIVGGVGGAILGGGAGAALGPLASRAQTLAQRMAAPTLDRETALLAQRAQGLGIPLSITQAAPSRTRDTIQKVSQAIPFSGVGKFEDSQVSAWNNALGKTIGLDTEKLTPESVNQFLKNTEDGYSKALEGTTVRMGADSLSALDNITQEAAMSLGDDAAKTVAKNVEYVKAQLKGGFIRGEKANSIRKQVAVRAGSGSPEIKDWLGQIATTVNDSIAASIPAERAQMLTGLNRQYRNFKTIEPLLEKSTDGSVNPTQLLQRVASSKYIKASRAEVGQDDLVDLARIGKLLPKLSGSDTYEKAYLAGAAGLGTVGGAAVSLPKTVATVGANRAYQSLYNQSQDVLKQSIKKSLTREERKAAFEAAKKTQGK